MPGKKKKFIDKKNAVTFYLGHRSQRDPLIADETAPQRVLIPLDQLPSTSAGPPKQTGSKGDPVKRKEEQTKYGIYFDDDYDYLQHLKDSNDDSNLEWDICERIYAPTKPVEEVEKKVDSKDVKLRLPSSVFESEFQEDVGLLNKAAVSTGPRPDLDPDVLAALDDDFDFSDPENELDDNFMQLATGAKVEEIGESSSKMQTGEFDSDDDDYEDDDSDMYEDEDGDSVGSLKGPQYTFADEETKSRFTNYSMSSSVIRRNKDLCLLDDRFEKMFEDYEDTEIGALDCDEIEGHMDTQSDLLLKYAQAFEEDQKKEDGLNFKIARLAVDGEESDDVSDDDSEEDVKEKWDCESILSTYSTTKNRPKLIRETSQRNKIKVAARTGMPVGVLGHGLTAGNLKTLDRENNEDNDKIDTKSVLSKMSVARNKEETPEEKNQRKKLVKELRRERRLEKKANVEAFKEEKKRMGKIRLNAKVAIPGLKL